MLDAAYFYLQTSVHASSPASTSLFGLAYWPNYHYYRGHVMWDIEMFAVPPLVLTNPEAARSLLNTGQNACLPLAITLPWPATAERSFPGRAALATGRSQRPGKAPRAHTSIT